MKIKSKKKVNIILLFALMLLCCGFVFIFAGGSVSASASSNTDINDISMIEYTNHTHTNNVKDCSSYSEQPNRNSGIRIYGSVNSGSLKYNSTVKVDSNSVYVDFRNAVALYMENCLKGFDDRLSDCEKIKEKYEKDLSVAKEQVDKPFEQAEEVGKLREELAEIDTELDLGKQEEPIIMDEDTTEKPVVEILDEDDDEDESEVA